MKRGGAKNGRVQYWEKGRIPVEKGEELNMEESIIGKRGGAKMKKRSLKWKRPII